MDALECIETRRSIRSFRNIPVEFEKIGNILNAARLAPSSGNLQDWKFILVTEEGLRKQLAEACLQQYWMEQAPVHIVVCSEPAKTQRMYGKRGEELYCIQNCAVAAQNALLAAHAQGLGACFVGAFDERLVRKALSIPASARPMAILPVGYPDEAPQEPSKHPLSAVTFIERWGNRIRDFAAFIGYYSQHVAKAAQWAREKIRSLLEKWSS